MTTSNQTLVEELMITMKHLTTIFLSGLLLLGLASPVWAEAPEASGEKVVFHLDETASARWALMLARSYSDDNPKASVVFVAYGPGIDFLLEDAKDKRGNPYEPAVLTLIDRGVDFRVCATTLTARSIAKEELLDAVSVVPSGISEIVRLQLKEGYAYLKP
jgi:intracellular sulfur oxidation DsrE/DsrF family protein